MPDELRPDGSTAGAAPATRGKPPTNRLAIWSLVVNLLGAPIGSILAIVLGNRSLRQIRESEGRESGRSLALAGVIWGWAAIGVTALILLIILGGNSAPVITRGDVGQQVATLAFAERYYYEEHLEFTSDLDKLNADLDERIGVGVWVGASGQTFCVEAYGGDDEHQYRAATWDHEFEDDGETVNWWRRSSGCNETSQRPAGIPTFSA
jgi:hypothetical protein